MDIDAARKTKATPDTCQCCRKTGHWVKECDLHFDVQYMDTDEIERELENKFAAKDVASTESSTLLCPTGSRRNQSEPGGSKQN